MLTATVTEYMPEASSPAPVVDIDQALARSAARGEVAAFESLYRRHVGRVHGVIARLVGHQGARAEDLTQETFVRAWQALPGYRFESAFGTWLYRLAANTALMELRARRSRPQAALIAVFQKWRINRLDARGAAGSRNRATRIKKLGLSFAASDLHLSREVLRAKGRSDH